MVKKRCYQIVIAFKRAITLETLTKKRREILIHKKQGRLRAIIRSNGEKSNIGIKILGKINNMIAQKLLLFSVVSPSGIQILTENELTMFKGSLKK